MKNIINFVLQFLVIMGCSKDNTDDNNSILGKWQMVELCLSDGSTGNNSTDCVQTENGYTFQFNEDGTFTKQDNLSICSNGVFTFNNTDIFLEYINEIGCPLIGDAYILDYKFLEQKLSLIPSEENNTCDEGCEERFKRIPIEE